MNRTANLRRQHDAVVEIVEQLTADIKEPQPNETQVYKISLSLAKLTGILRIHFVIEDRTLYPYMTTSTHAEAATTAAAFQDEMGTFSATYSTFAERWDNRTIGAAFPAFRSEAHTILAALADRIARENAILYPLADAISIDQSRQTA